MSGADNSDITKFQRHRWEGKVAFLGNSRSILSALSLDSSNANNVSLETYNSDGGCLWQLSPRRLDVHRIATFNNPNADSLVGGTQS